MKFQFKKFKYKEITEKICWLVRLKPNYCRSGCCKLLIYPFAQNSLVLCCRVEKKIYFLKRTKFMDTGNKTRNVSTFTVPTIVLVYGLLLEIFINMWSVSDTINTFFITVHTTSFHNQIRNPFAKNYQLNFDIMTRKLTNSLLIHEHVFHTFNNSNKNCYFRFLFSYLKARWLDLCS